LLIPFVLVFALPMGMLTAALLVFGRFSADHELTAARASGVSLVSLVTPVLLLSCALSVVCAAVNMYVAPQCRVAYKRILWEMGVNRGLMLPEKTFIKDIKDCIFYIGAVKGSNLEDILIFKLRDEKVESHIKAARGVITIEPANQIIRVKLMDGWETGHDEQVVRPRLFSELELPPYTNKPPSQYEEKVKLTDMTFSQLSAQLREMEARLRRPIPWFRTNEDLRNWLRRMERQRDDLTLPLKMQMHRQVSFSFACIAFTLVGIPLGIRAHRRETTFGIFLALILVLAYYSFFIFGQAMDTRPEMAPHLILWLPNFLFQVVGGILLWRANRGI